MANKQPIQHTSLHFHRQGFGGRKESYIEKSIGCTQRKLVISSCWILNFRIRIINYHFRFEVIFGGENQNYMASF